MMWSVLDKWHLKCLSDIQEQMLGRQFHGPEVWLELAAGAVGIGVTVESTGLGESTYGEW